jgi:hypothetical protein
LRYTNVYNIAIETRVNSGAVRIGKVMKFVTENDGALGSTTELDTTAILEGEVESPAVRDGNVPGEP